ncbi:cache domain-containing protein [Paenibacillus sp. GD4]|uniref:cache domain-containing sensor histidine kinase n=1 Tax=Paenibacillus sp. GD4 TaxID=3068890 RepID=UPI002796C854|nr:cache domain-containing protein [Paenibacillus sp. GD4]MDQ1909103.1 cache domain-containing protein [Paenibacillus sp. GD4]
MLKLSLFVRTYAMFFSVILLTLLLIGWFAYYYSSSKLETQVEKYMEQIVETIGAQTDTMLASYDEASKHIAADPDVRRFMDIERLTRYEQFEYYLLIRDTVFKSLLDYYPDINRIYLISSRGEMIYLDRGTEQFRESMLTEEIRTKISDIPTDGNIAVLPSSLLTSDRSQITVARKVRGTTDFERRGVFAIEFDTAKLSSLWDRMNKGEGGYFFIADQEGKLIYHPRSELIGQAYEMLTAKALQGASITEMTWDEQRQIVLYRESPLPRWGLFLAVSKEWMNDPVVSIRTSLLAVGAGTLLLTLWLALLFSRSITRPIDILRRSMRHTAEGDFRPVAIKNTGDEISELACSYNLMVERLSEMIQRVYAAELHRQKETLERQKAEYQALQLQINPHFLYNTLAALNSYALDHGADEISDMTEALTFMLRYAVQTDLDAITVANELNHVRYYLLILQYRTGKPFEIEVRIDPSLLLHHMVRLTLQPLVENVFQHAFHRMKDKAPQLVIGGELRGEELWIHVEDNGIGMTAEQLGRVRGRLLENRLGESGEGNSGVGGIGMMNVHRRIQMVFGESYGLSVQSEAGQGTIVSMRLPGIENKYQTGML